METSGFTGMGLVTAIAVSGGVVFIARHFHKRLHSNFMKQIEFTFSGPRKCKRKKMVRFEDQAMKTSDEASVECVDGMPLNRQVLYKGIIQSRYLKGYDSFKF